MPPQEGHQQPIRRIDSETDFSEGEDGPKVSYRDYRVKKSKLIGMINWTHVIGTYFPHIIALGIAVLLGLVVNQIVVDNIISNSSVSDETTLLDKTRVVLSATSNLAREVFQHTITLFHIVPSDESSKPLFGPQVKITFLVLCILLWIARMEDPVYLMGFSTFKAPDSWKASHKQIMTMMKNQQCFNDESLKFMERILERSGTGQATAWPPGIIKSLEGCKADRSMEASRLEAETVICDVVDKALKKAKVHPKEIDVLVINCSLFSPTPSLCALVVSKFGMRSNIMTYNLSGMGCGASLISVDLAKNMIQRKSNSGMIFGGGSKALVVSTEVITPNLYHGNERAFLLQNTLFRCGGAAMVLSTDRRDGMRAMYKLLNIVRVQGTDEKSYKAVYETQDAEGHRGVMLSKEIVKVAGKCMEKNMTTLGPYVLPITEQIKVVVSLAYRFAMKQISKIMSKGGKETWIKQLPRVYVPDFKRGIDHFCIHAGGRAVIDGIEKNMKLELFHTEPSRMALLNYGNTSSSSIWYEMEYIQDLQKSNPLKKGDRIMQVAFGSGFKCTSGVWLKL
mmetsp:Transcript_6648/g.9719  ORF Transcript_6648/g.9719 Transcript_6648/m.9719 type:complete len:565 (-) Transcript_6648:232-1926(-)|eukprot:CAMPEP_0195522158 /NCGR_PEP_ID=MMETSP0794_2-20130614/20073_1 /TAXON_ID=515487 /ORGANISM="Stephanopyxis turris, Strain CCMP 815" /LENGTH=564 /DNA_ID=CAMNT_0040651849 /DNA_START=92 /DNA_END=1786 /DNA_ORIENTATION=+